jgi:hypothetical protein
MIPIPSGGHVRLAIGATDMRSYAKRRIVRSPQRGRKFSLIDPQLQSPMRERGREFGIAEGSRLDRVVQDLDRALRREIDIDHGLRRDRGLSLGV